MDIFSNLDNEFFNGSYSHNLHDEVVSMLKENSYNYAKNNDIFVSSNLNIHFEEAKLTDLFDENHKLYELIKIGQSKTNRNDRECLMFKIMLPTQFFEKTIKQQQKITNEVIKQITFNNMMNLIYFTNVVRYGKGVYMNVVLIDKEIYPEGKLVNDFYNNNQYRSKDTNKIISREEYFKNPEAAYIKFKKGEMKQEKKTVYVSHKFRMYSGTKEQYLRTKGQVQLKIQEVVNSYFTDTKPKKWFKAHSYHEYDRKKQKNVKKDYSEHNKYNWYFARQCKAINLLISSLNKYLNEAYLSLENPLYREDDFDDDKAFNRKYSSQIKQFKFKLNKVRHAVVNNVYEFEKNIEDLIVKFTNKPKEIKNEEVDPLLIWGLKTFGDLLNIAA